MDNDGKRLLIVDDEPLNLDVVESFLEGAGYNITRAADGPEALAAVRESPPDLVLLDVMMPGMDGFEVCRRLRKDETTYFIPVVMVTSLDSRGDRVAAIDAGADDFITKPVDKSELLARVKSLLKVKSLHDELEKKYREVVELQIMKDNLIQMLVHDFKNPLTGVLGYLDLLDDGIASGKYDDCRQYIHNAHYLSKKMATMVDDLLDLSRLECNMLPLKLESVNLMDIIEENIREFGHAMDDMQLKTVVGPEMEDIFVNADKTLFKRVVGNILSNAIRHSPDRGVITFNITTSGGMTALSISDQGAGIPEGLLDKVFEKFYQAEAKASNVRSGAGLGLAFCDMVVKAHGGKIKAENIPQGGTRFTIYLPSL